MSRLSFQHLRIKNRSRVKRWHGPAGVDDWTVTDWSNAAAGEMGEVCNAVKKLRRIQTGAANRNHGARSIRSLDKALQVIGKEIADTIIYLDLLALKLKIDTAWEIRDKFNRTSVKYKFPERL